MELNNIEKLAIAQAFYNHVGSLVKTKEQDNLRGAVDAELTAIYEQTGAKSFDVKLLGQKVGSYSITVSKPKESKPDYQFKIADKEQFKNWEDFKGAAMDFALSNLEVIAEWAFGKSGEIPDGCEVKKVEIPGTPGGTIERTALRVDTQAVVETLGGQLEAATRELLEGGE